MEPHSSSLRLGARPLSIETVTRAVSFALPHVPIRKERVFSRAMLERLPIGWTHLIEKESLKFKELEHVLIEKMEQLFRNML